jgi:hypothetical protein
VTRRPREGRAVASATFQLRQQPYEPHGVMTHVRDRYEMRGAKARLERSEVVAVGDPSPISAASAKAEPAAD